MDEADLKRHIAYPLQREYREVLEALRATILAIPESEWARGESKGAQPVRQVGHMLYAIESYLGGHRTRQGERFGVCVESFKAAFDPVNCPRRETFLPWIDEVEQIAMDGIDKAVTLSVTGAAKQHPPLHIPTYLLRHTVVHYTTLRIELERRGLKLPDY
jgi:hypothetical protein